MRKLCAIAFLTATLQAQTPPRVQQIAQLPPAWTDRALFSMDSTLRSLDVRSTYALLNDPCRCFKEADPIAPKGRGIGQITAFQVVAGGLVMGGANYLRSKGHPKWARVLLVADIVSETWAVQNNVRLLNGSR